MILGEHELELVLTSQHDERIEVAILYSNEGTKHRAAWLALGLCWPRFRRHHSYTRDPLGYSSTVVNELTKAGATPQQIFAAAGEALVLVLQNLALVDGSETFSGGLSGHSGAPEETGSAGASSTSRGRGRNTRAG